PEREDARFRLTGYLLELGQGREALPHLEYLHRRQPDNVGITVRLARCRNYLGETDEATKLLEAVLARQPNYAPALAERGGAALRWLRSALQEDPRYAPAHEALADYYLATGNRGLAARHRALGESPR